MDFLITFHGDDDEEYLIKKVVSKVGSALLSEGCSGCKILKVQITQMMSIIDGQTLGKGKKKRGLYQYTEM